VTQVAYNVAVFGESTDEIIIISTPPKRALQKHNEMNLFLSERFNIQRCACRQQLYNLNKTALHNVQLHHVQQTVVIYRRNII